MIAARQVGKPVGGTAVLRGVTLSVRAAEWASETGKTTFPRLAATVLRPTAGRMTGLGRHGSRDRQAVRGHFGPLAHGDPPLRQPGGAGQPRAPEQAGGSRRSSGRLVGALAAVDREAVADRA